MVFPLNPRSRSPRHSELHCETTNGFMREDKQESRRRNRSRGRTTSLDRASTRATKTGHRVHQTTNNASSAADSSAADGKSKKPGRARGRETLRDRKPRERHVYDTPFDKGGRCHYHVNVQLATKKFHGGWHVLLQVCPKCMEQKHHGSRDEPLVRSSTTSARSSSGGGGHAQGKQHDDNGCCVVHSHIQVAKKNFLGGGWKVRIF